MKNTVLLGPVDQTASVFEILPCNSSIRKNLDVFISEAGTEISRKPLWKCSRMNTPARIHFYLKSMRINCISKIWRVHRATTAVNDASLLISTM